MASSSAFVHTRYSLPVAGTHDAGEDLKHKVPVEAGSLSYGNLADTSLDLLDRVLGT